jgi:peptide/nickel transport system ATP-binding protein
MKAALPLLEVKRLSVDYLSDSGAVHAVNDVSFTLHRGEVLGLAGESGCGKSTLAYAIARLLEPPAFVTAGELLYHRPPRSSQSDAQLPELPVTDSREDEQQRLEILRLSPAQLRAFRWNDLAIVFQSAMNALNPVATVGAQIDDVIRAHRPLMSAQERKERARALLQLVGIAPDRLKSYPHELSGGMRQRAIIAIALALTPEIIIMDEPTTALDVVVQREILTELLRLREQLHFSVIFITHDLSLLLEIADNIAIMYAGRMVETTTARALKAQPRHPYSYGLLHSFPTLRGPRRSMVGIAGSPPDLRASPPGCPFHPRCPLAFAPCPQIVPPLLPMAPPAVDQAVACHLYDPQHATREIPTNADFAAAYDALSESMSGVRRA